MILTLAILAIVVVVLWLGGHFVIGITMIKSDEVGLVEKRFSHRGSLDKAHHRAERRGRLPARRAARRHASACPSSTASTSCRSSPSRRARSATCSRATASRCPRRRSAASCPGNNFQDVRSFLREGRPARPQRKILREGTYAINLAQFVVLTEERLYCLALDSNDGGPLERMGASSPSEGFRPVIIRGAARDGPPRRRQRSKSDGWAGEEAPEGADEPQRRAERG